MELLSSLSHKSKVKRLLQCDVLKGDNFRTLFTWIIGKNQLHNTSLNHVSKQKWDGLVNLCWLQIKTHPPTHLHTHIPKQASASSLNGVQMLAKTTCVQLTNSLAFPFSITLTHSFTLPTHCKHTYTNTGRGAQLALLATQLVINLNC